MERVAVWAGLLVGLGSQNNPQDLAVAIEFRPYQRQFVQPLQTAHGPWRSRQGLILKLQSPTGRSSYGEIAPIPWFGTETLAEAIAFLKQLQAGPATRPLADLSAIVERSPAHYSATRFGLGMALAQLQGNFSHAVASPQPEAICALLPTGSEALQAWASLWKQGHRTFKWKLGIGELAQELFDLEALRRSLPPQAKLRLDANGGLSLTTAQQCLNRCDALTRQGLPIEFLEQPLPPEQFDALMGLSQTYQTPLALDESVTGMPQLMDCHQRGWQGIFMIKGAIAGDPVTLVQYCKRHQLQVVFSSVFETGLARQAVFSMAQALRSKINDPNPCPTVPQRTYALGFGVSQWLQPDGLDGQDQPTDLTCRGEHLWQRLIATPQLLD